MVQATPKATFNDLATAAAATYQDPNGPQMGSQWIAIQPDPSLTASNSAAGYFGQAWVNPNTGELIIADRGTIPTNGQDLISDGELAVGLQTGAQEEADKFALYAVQQVGDYLAPGVSLSNVYTTGHSLGGYESQGQTVLLTTSASDNLIPTGVNFTNFSIDAPGIAGIPQTGSSSEYVSYNVSAQGDLIHLAGGQDLAGTTNVSLPVGPPMSATGELISLGTALETIPAVGIVAGTAVIEAGIYEALDAHSVNLIQSSMASTAFGSMTVATANDAHLTSTQLQTLFGVSPTAQGGSAYDTVWTMPGQGQITTFEINSATGSNRVTVTDASGNVIAQLTTTDVQTLSNGVTTTTATTTDAAGHLLQTSIYIDGVLQNQWLYDASGNLNGRADYVYSANGQLSYVNAWGAATVNASHALIKAENSGSVLNISGVGDTLTAGALYEPYTMYGQTFNLASGDSIKIIDDGGNTINAGASVAVTLAPLASTMDGLEVINAVDDAAGGVTADGQATGITLLQGTNVRINGKNNSITSDGGTYIQYATDDVINLNGNGVSISFGGANTINAGNGTKLSTNGENNDVIVGNNLQIGENGESLTLEGTGDTVSGAGALKVSSDVTLSSGGNFTIYAQDDAVGGSALGGTTGGIVLGSGVTATVVGSDNAITAAGNDNISASNDDITVTGSGSTISGNNNTITAADGLGLTLKNSTGDRVIGNGESLIVNNVAVTLQGSGFKVSGSGNTLTFASGTSDSVSLAGANNTIDAGPGVALAILASPGTVTVNASDDAASGQTAGNQEAGITLATNVNAIVNGGGDTITAVGNNVLTASSAEITLVGSGSRVTGNNDTITASGVTVAGIYGSNDVLTGGNDTISGGDTTDNPTLEGNGYVISASFADFTLAAGASATVTGAGDVITAGAGAAVTLDYSDLQSFGFLSPVDSVFAAAGDVVTMNASADANVFGSGVTIEAAGGNFVYAINDTILLSGSGTSVSGSGNTVRADNGLTLGLSGNGNVVFGDHETISSIGGSMTLDGTGDAVAASGSTVTLQGGESAVFSRGGDTINAAAGDAVTIGSTHGYSADTINAVGVAAGALTADGQPSGIVLNAQAQVTVVGSGDTIALQGSNVVTASADTIEVNGGGDRISGKGDTIVFAAGAANAQIEGSNETLMLDDPQVTLASLRVTAGNNGGDLVLTDAAAGVDITLTGMLGKAGAGAAEVELADDTILSAQQLVDLETAGGNGNGTLYGWVEGGNVFDSQGAAAQAIGHGNGDTFDFNAGYGNLRIDEHDTSADPDNLIKLGAGISASSVAVAVAANGADLILTDGVAGDQITVEGMLEGNTNAGITGIQQVEFADGTALSSAQLMAIAGIVNRVNSVNADGSQTDYAYYGDGSFSSVTLNAAGQEVQSEKVAASGSVVVSNYAPATGAITSIEKINAAGQETQSSVFNTDGSHTDYYYDPSSGNETSKNMYNASGEITETKTYDASGNTSEVTYYTYDPGATYVDSYDSNGNQLSGTTIYADGSRVATTYNSAADQNLTTVVDTNSAGEVTQIATTVAGASAGTYDTTLTDGSGNVLGSQIDVYADGVLRSKSEYNAAGQETESKTYDASGNRAGVTYYTYDTDATYVDSYDSKGNQLSGTTICPDGSRVATTYNSATDSNLTTVVDTNSAGVVTQIATTVAGTSGGTYDTTLTDGSGTLLGSEIDVYADGVLRSKSEYNAAGQETESKTYDASGNKSDVTYYTYDTDATYVDSYDSNGNQLSGTTIYSDGSRAATTYNSTTDSNLTTVVDTNSAGDVTQIATTVAGASAGTYDTTLTDGLGTALGSQIEVYADGVLRSKSEYNAAGQETESKTYDASGDMSTVTYYTYDTGATYVDRYDSSGKQLSGTTIYPDGSSVQTTYDPATGAVISTTDINADGSPSSTNGGYYGFAGPQTVVQAALASNIGPVAESDLSQGNQAGAAAAEAGFKEAQAAAAAPQTAGTGSSIFESAQWDTPLVTWSLASDTDSRYESDAQQAFATWAAASGINFQEVANAGHADIQLSFGDLNTATSGVVGYTSFQASGGEMTKAQIELEASAQDALVAGADGQLTYSGTDATLEQTMLHEIGHALGLADNSDQDSIMYYDLTANNRTLDSTDIAGIHSLYGSSSAMMGASAVQPRLEVGAQALSGDPAPGADVVNQLIAAMATFNAQPAAETGLNLGSAWISPLGPEMPWAAHAR